MLSHMTREKAQSMRACSLRWVRQDRAQRRRVGTRTPRWRRCADALFRAKREKSLAARSCTSADFMLATPDLRPFLSMLEDGRYGCSARCVAYGARHRRGGGIAEIAFRCLPMWHLRQTLGGASVWWLGAPCHHHVGVPMGVGPRPGSGGMGRSLNSPREGKQHASRAQKSPRCTAESSAMAVVGAE